MSYRISNLIIKNFKCIDDFAFNFENKELIVFDGPNGYGKTTIFDAIEIILTGKPRRINENNNILANYSYKESPIHKNNSLPIHLEVSLKNDNEDILKIQRIFQPAPSQKSIRNNPQKIYENSQLSIFLNDVEMENGIKEENVLNFHNIKNLFNVLNYVEQDENTLFLKKNPKDKYKSLTSLLGIENELKQLNNLESFLKTTKNKFEQLEDQKKRMEEEIKNLSSDNNSLEYKKLLIDVEKTWDKEKIEISNIDLKNSFLKELEKVEFLFNNRALLNDIRYIIYQKPLTLVLPGKGQLPDSCGFEGSETIKMWSVRKGTMASKIDLTSGKVEELLPSGLRGLIGAGIKIKNVTYENGELKGRIEVWVKVGVKISHGENFSINTGLGSWVTITGFDLGIADVKVQVKLDNINKVCARIKACADFPWPIEQCAKATHCVNF
ncbi:MAG: AAA family ATPase [Flavobacteriaceae bacterium]|nr:MAG: AAA family ATPase [Flavobacteriaceae bacterium]